MNKALGTIGFSIFIGLLMGLSSAPVVGVVVGILAGLIGLVVGAGKGSAQEKIQNTSPNYTLLGLFGLFAMVGVLAGLYIRTTDPWGKSLSENKAEWVDLGLSEAKALELVIFQTTGLVPQGTEVKEISPTSLPVLFSDDGPSDKLNPGNFTEVSDIAFAWADEGEPWSIYQQRIMTKIDENDQRKAFETLWELLKD